MLELVVAPASCSNCVSKRDCLVFSGAIIGIDLGKDKVLFPREWRACVFIQLSIRPIMLTGPFN